MFRRIGRVAAAIDGPERTMLVLGLAGPAAGAKTTDVKVVINDDGCPAKLTIKAGPTTFKVTNEGNGDVSEFEVLSGDRIIGEVENIAPGLNSEFSLTLKAGDYTTQCPGGSKHVNGQAHGHRHRRHQAHRPTARRRSTSTAATSTTQTAELVTATKAFTDAVDAGNVEQAKTLYTPCAGRLRADRAGGRDLRRPRPRRSTPARVTCPRRSGAGSTPSRRRSGSTVPPTASIRRTPRQLNENVERSRTWCRTSSCSRRGIANGAVELLNEVSASKITGEEERYSRTDLVDFEANVQGSQAAFDAVKPLLTEQERRARDADRRAIRRGDRGARAVPDGRRRSWRTPTLTTDRHEGAVAGDRRARRAALEGRRSRS